MKIKLQVTLDVHLRDWAAEYGFTDLGAAATDAQTRIRAAVRSGDLDNAIAAAWPALGDLSTATVELSRT